MSKILLYSLFFLFFMTNSYAENQLQNLNNEVLEIKQQVDILQSNINNLNIKLTDLDRKTSRTEFDKRHPKEKSEFVVIHKMLLLLFMFFFVGVGIFIGNIFRRT